MLFHLPDRILYYVYLRYAVLYFCVCFLSAHFLRKRVPGPAVLLLASGFVKICVVMTRNPEAACVVVEYFADGRQNSIGRAERTQRHPTAKLKQSAYVHTCHPSLVAVPPSLCSRYQCRTQVTDGYCCCPRCTSCCSSSTIREHRARCCSPCRTMASPWRATVASD